MGSSKKFQVEVAMTLKNAIKNLPDILRTSKLELLVIFLYDSLEESFYVQPTNVATVNA